MLRPANLHFKTVKFMICDLILDFKHSLENLVQYEKSDEGYMRTALLVILLYLKLSQPFTKFTKIKTEGQRPLDHDLSNFS